MKNLFLFLWRNNYTIFFLLLEVWCFYLIIMNNNFQNASAFNSSNKAVAKVMEGINYFNEYINLKTTNSSLARENAQLRSLLPEAYYDTGIVRNFISDTSKIRQYSFLTAKVINNSVNRRNNYLSLNKGSVQGVKSEMGVITGSGVVGMVKNVSEHYCTVMSLLNKDARISARFKNNNYFGSLLWEGFDPKIAELKEIAKHVTFKTGDSIVTTAYSAVFPENIMIGTVQSFEIKPGDNFYTIHVKLSVDFSNISYVNIVDNALKSEQQQIEAETIKNDH